ncbi:MAG: hypothetical protein ACTS73_01915 [Arsenophonus sp. NEOnobi-MAG3]
MNNFNNREIIYHEKVYHTQVSTKPDISCDPLNRLICNSTRQLITTAVKLDVEKP